MNRPPRKSRRIPPAKRTSKDDLPQKGILRFDAFEPELAFRETRSVTVFTPESGLPLDDYGFIEFYCADPSCDCRRAILQVWSEKNPGKALATIGYGWEDEAFYTKWMHGDAKMAKQLKGPDLEPMQPQSNLAGKLLALFKGTVMQDESYLQRLQTHYKLAKKKQGAQF
jgi:hypothetical protein